MKQFYYLMLIPLCMGIMIACSSDDSDSSSDNPVGQGASNKSVFYVSDKTYKSIEISANVNDMVRIYLEGFGVKDASPADYASYGLSQSNLKIMMQQLFYVVLSDNLNFSGGYWSQSSGNIEGNNIKYLFNDLQPGKTYYFRVYQMSPSNQYVFNDAVPVETKDIEAKTENVSYATATISHSGSFEIYIDGFQYVEADKDYNWTKVFKNSVTIKGLQPGTSYRFNVCVDGVKGKDIRFTTKSLDLSGTKVEAKEEMVYENRIHGTWEFTITSDLVNKLSNNNVRFGVAQSANFENDSNGNYITYVNYNGIYTADSNNPYHVSFPWVIDGHSGMGAQYLSELEWMYSKIENGTADKSDKDRYGELASYILQQAYVYPISAFVEIDGERVFIGSSYDAKY